ncbi:MAG: response regulator [Proteobacteria bacterium]|nr:response regulator [Pseudomonadota bacterium]
MLTAEVLAALSNLGISPAPRGRVMLVDDEPENLDVLTALLEDEWEVHTCFSGPEALALIERTGPPDLLIADQRMPEMTGIELLTRVAVSCPATVRVVLTGFGDLEPMLEAINRGAAYRFLLKPADPDELRSIAVEALRLHTSVWALTQLVNALSDHRARLDRTLRELHSSQERALAAERLTTVGRSIAGIAHDLRNTAAIVLILVDLVRQHTDAPEVLQRAETAWASLGSLLELLEQIRDYAQSNVAAAKREATETQNLITGALRLLCHEPLAAGRDIAIEIDPAAAMLDLDRARVRQSVMALLRNGCRASAPPETVRLIVRPGPHHARREARIEVIDSGCGMDAATLLRAQRPFFSGFDPPGIGLGLEIARLAAAAHDGRFELDSSPDRGTRATLVLGAALPEALAAPSPPAEEAR